MEKDDGENEEMTERMKEFGSMERDDGCWGGGGISVGIPPVRKLKLPPPPPVASRPRSAWHDGLAGFLFFFNLIKKKEFYFYRTAAACAKCCLASCSGKNR